MMKTNQLCLIAILMFLCGCGLMGRSTVPKEQIDKDISDKVVDVQEGTTAKWVFAADDQRCFKVFDDESKSTDSSADIMVNVASWQDMTLGGNTTYLTVFGRMLMKYKKENDKWVLEKIEPKDLIYKNLEMDQYKKWLDIQMPLCTYSRFVSKLP